MILVLKAFSVDSELKGRDILGPCFLKLRQWNKWLPCCFAFDVSEESEACEIALLPSAAGCFVRRPWKPFALCGAGGTLLAFALQGSLYLVPLVLFPVLCLSGPPVVSVSLLCCSSISATFSFSLMILSAITFFEFFCFRFLGLSCFCSSLLVKSLVILVPVLY